MAQGCDTSFSDKIYQPNGGKSKQRLGLPLLCDTSGWLGSVVGICEGIVM